MSSFLYVLERLYLRFFTHTLFNSSVLRFYTDYKVDNAYIKVYNLP